MNLAAKTALILAGGLFFGVVVWLWVRHGSEVFITYADAFLAWCL